MITLTSDFGYRDPFVGQMKGVILSINPSATIIDITHEIEPFNIEEGAYAVGSSYRFFPAGTIHVAVVDPGVGSERRAIIAEAGGHYFVGPDNGIFSPVLSLASTTKIVHILNEKFMLSKESPTFQGRDLFSPVAAWLSTGDYGIEDFGPFIDDHKVLPTRNPQVEEGRVTGEVICLDRFGNAITNIRKGDLPGFEGDFSVQCKGERVEVLRSYSQGMEKSLSCLINSSGRLELFVSRGSAAHLFGIAKGDYVIVLPAE